MIERKTYCKFAPVINYINKVDDVVQRHLEEQATLLGEAKREVNICFFAYYEYQYPPCEKNDDGTFDRLPKKEVALLKKEQEKLAKNLSGIKEMRKVPNALFVIDPNIEHNAVSEAIKLNIPVFAIVDTNADPDLVTYPIPANDDAIRSVSLIMAVVADAIVEAKGGLPVVAYTKEEGEDITMKEVIKQTDKENAEKLAKIRAERAARAAQYQHEQELKQASHDKAAAVIEEEKEIKAEKTEKKPAAPKAKKPAAPKAEAEVKAEGNE